MDRVREEVVSALHYYTLYGRTDLGIHIAYVDKKGYSLVADLVARRLTNTSRPEIYFEFDKMRADHTLADIAHHHAMWEQEQLSENN